MILKDFIDQFVERNSLVRVLYKTPTGHKLILKDWDEIDMEHQILKGKGKYGPYINHNVVGVASIATSGHYQETINIVIEEIPLHILREEKINRILF